MPLRRVRKAISTCRFISSPSGKAVSAWSLSNVVQRLSFRHGINQPQIVEGRRHRTQSVSSSVTAASTTTSSVLNTADEGQPSILEPTYAAVSPPPTGSMSIGSIIEPNAQHGFSQPLTSWSESYSIQAPIVTTSYATDFDYGNTTNTEQYSSDSCYSPSSEGYPSASYTQTYLPRSDRPTVSYASGYQVSSLSTPWPGSEGYTESNESLGIGFEGPNPSAVGISWTIKGQGVPQANECCQIDFRQSYPGLWVPTMEAIIEHATPL